MLAVCGYQPASVLLLAAFRLRQRPGGQLQPACVPPSLLLRPSTAGHEARHQMLLLPQARHRYSLVGVKH